MAVGGIPNVEFVAETLGLEFNAIQQPDYYTSVKTVDEPDFSETARGMVIGVEAPAILYWTVDRDPESPTREENNAELTPMLGVLVIAIVKGQNVQRQQRLIDVDIEHVMLGNCGRNRPGYSGPNTWAGLMTNRRAGTRSIYDIPDLGVGLVVSRWDIDYRSPFPAG